MRIDGVDAVLMCHGVSHGGACCPEGLSFPGVFQAVPSIKESCWRFP